MKYILAVALAMFIPTMAFADMENYKSPVVQYFIDHPDVNSLTLYDCVVQKATTAEEACKKTAKRTHTISRAKLFDEEHYWPTDVANFRDEKRPENVIVYHEAKDNKITSGYFVRIEGRTVTFIQVHYKTDKVGALQSTKNDFDENLLGVYDFDDRKSDAEPHRKFFSKLVPDKASKGGMRVSHE